ncbi:uncharacterized protein LOC130783028 [Actinidia eriantha]|uniref:uncharacterized protein LOC130783028 n=1 Tax=Actinidia eriantha TaxID=165200 RepID=UPI0025869963|nr:uncharacterized protein LOC130783028 [Actinidia eriantha]
MELNKNLQNLIERAWGLHDEISFFRFCGVSDTPLERESLIDIRDSIKNVENMLVCLQRLNLWKEKDLYEAILRLEESRMILMEKVGKYQGRKIEVVEELNSCFGDGKFSHNWNLKRLVEKMTEPPRSRKGNSHFLVHWIWSFLNPWNWNWNWNWHKSAGVALKLVLISASISYTMRFCSSRRKIQSFGGSKTAKEKNFIQIDSKITLDVFHGRG